MKQYLLQVIVGALLTCVPSAFAADLYRCGNTFQDTPCKSTVNTQPMKKNISPVRNENVAADNQTVTTVDADCRQIGETAKKIMWMREIGKTADDQIAAPPAGASPDLIRDVYNHKGSSLQVKNDIEQECMQQKERDKLAEKLMIEAERLRAGRSIPSNNTNKNKLSIDPALAEKSVK